MQKSDINNHFDDKVIRKLFNDFTPDEAPDTLKKNTMNKVFKEWSESPLTYKPLISKANRLWIIAGMAAIIALAFIVDLSLLNNYFQQLNINSSFTGISDLDLKFTAIFSTLKNIPSIIYIVGIAVIILAGIDQFYNRLANI